MTSGYKMRRVVSVESNFRMNYPWRYELACGHVFYGQKSRYERGGPVHPARIKCSECGQAAGGEA